jgi:hypothetical protein
MIFQGSTARYLSWTFAIEYLRVCPGMVGWLCGGKSLRVYSLALEPEARGCRARATIPSSRDQNGRTTSREGIARREGMKEKA